MRVRRALARLVRAGRPRSQGRKHTPASPLRERGFVARYSRLASGDMSFANLWIPAFAGMTGLENGNNSAIIASLRPLRLRAFALISAP